ncbi:MAG: hypothetical protein ABL919_15940 [Methylococcales bacterium]
MSNNITPRYQSQSRKHTIKPYSPFPSQGEVYLRDAYGTCAKAVFQNNSFTWVDINREDYPAANSGWQAG